MRIGSPITGYGQESRNRAARQRIPHRVWTDEENVEHVEVNILAFSQIYLQMTTSTNILSELFWMYPGVNNLLKNKSQTFCLNYFEYTPGVNNL